MAKWGEGDPRWIVEERGDSHNVNNWHWREADATEWSKTFLKDLFCNISIDDSKVGQAKIISTSSLQGEASACVRKGKFICLFDWESIQLKWEANVAGVTDKFTGEINISGYDHDADDTDDFDISFKFNTDKTPKHPALDSFLRKEMPKSLWNAMTLYKETLRHDFAKKLAFEKQSGREQSSTESKNSSNPSPVKTVPTPNVQQPKSNGLPKNHSPKKQENVGTKINTKTITLTESFMASKSDVYDAFINIPKVRAWSQNSLKFSPEPKGGSQNMMKDTSFELFGGNVTGTITKLETDERIEMKWRLKQWNHSHYSEAVLEFDQTDNGTKVKLSQKSVPAEYTSNTLEGWKRYYFIAIKQTLGMGGSIGGLF